MEATSLAGNINEWYSQVHNKRGEVDVKLNGGGFKDFEKLLNMGGSNAGFSLEQR